MELKFKDLEENKEYKGDENDKIYALDSSKLLSWKLLVGDVWRYSELSMSAVRKMIFTEIVKPVEPETIESAWYECLIPDQGSMAGDIFCTSVSTLSTKYYRKVKPINESCTVFEVINE